MKIRTKDQVVLSVLKKMDERSLVGQKKYLDTNLHILIMIFNMAQNIF